MQARINDIEKFLTSAQEERDAEEETLSVDEKFASAVNSQVSENEKLELALIRNNLQWLESEDAGYCEQCGDEIPFARLQAVLATRLCIGCAEKA